MRQMIEEIVRAAVERAARDMGWPPDALAALDPAVERPREKGHGDWASTVALKLAKPLKLPPRQIAEAIAAAIQGDARIQSVEVAGPGFINLWMTAEALQEVIRQASSEGPAFARLAPASPPQRVNLEFISANPTGPMHVGHGRWAALGSALANLLEHAGWQVTREFYINDAGRQMDIFGESVVVRYLQLLGDPVEMPEESYGGAYVREIAQSLLDTQGPAWRTADPAERLVHFREYAYQQMLAQMQGLCERIGVHFDVWYSERSLYLPEAA
ncbi:MAG: arginine--tRNA ligase, partial [Coriobacteriia bacterium]|nr:arginine--tRNA ligase [Coriobacteriia bacterium]